ncbi:ninjurin-2 isoform X3 [Synchiropus splendidus]|uniref:ninjurin-2 isoform X3 n=1 Tax=Synchiropus splendidus TaxID=270530 RepID=UPI00237ECB66|nr:ninjurin-2 isoform X3 [Synchiropus splendidus]
MLKTERADQSRELDLASMRSTMPAGGPLQAGAELNMNLYATKKTAAEGMLDLALFLANVTHMKTVIEQGAGYRYYAAVLTLISFSLVLQIIAGVLIVIIGRRDLNDATLQRRLDQLNNAATATVSVTCILSLCISTFGIQSSGYFPWLAVRVH